MRALLVLMMVFPAALVLGCGGDGASPDAGVNTAVDQCVSSGDRAILQPPPPDGGGPDAGAVDAGASDAGAPEDPLVVAGDCAYTCLEFLVMSDPAPGRECMDGCFAASSFGALSAGCRTCIVDAIYCSGAYCTIECLGTDYAACNACLDLHCNDRLDACTGVPGL